MKNEESILKMNLEQKASLMSGKDFWQTKDIKELNIPSIFLADGPHGIRKQASSADHLGLNPSIPATCFPTAASMANSWNIELGYRLGEALGKEAFNQDVDVLLGPGTNIKRNPRCGRNFEYFSEDPYLAGKFAVSYIKGIQKSGVSACIKHFALNNQEERRMVLNTIVDERTLREIYLQPFEMAVKEGKTKTLMTSYNLINGTHANENKHLMLDILRKDFAFKGVVVTDWGGSNDRVKGLLCRNELEMPSTSGETNEDIIKAIKEGKIKEKDLDLCVDNLLTLILDSNKVKQKEKENFDPKSHHDLAKNCALESAVLLKNDNDALPLNKEEKIVLIGDFALNPRYQGAGSSIVNPTQLDTVVELIKNYNLNYLGFEKGFKRYGQKSKKLLNSALKLAHKADTILLFLGLDEITEAEGLDRKNILLPSNQLLLLNELSKLKKKVVVVLSCGSSIVIDFDNKVDAILHGYLFGQAGAGAILDILTGKVSPSGKLAETYPIKYEDVSSASNFLNGNITVEYRESIFVGYRYFNSNAIATKYPFGFGLSYSKFEYSDIKVNDSEVSFKIKNVGKVEAKEIAQLYIGLKNSKIFRATKELKGFIKVNLAPQEEKEVTIPFDDKTFRYFNIVTNKFEIEEGDYTIYIQSSIEDERLNTNLHVKGSTDIVPYNKDELPSYYNSNVSNVSLKEYEKLLGFKAPSNKYPFYKKNRMIIGYNTTVSELRYAKGFSGRLFSSLVKNAISFLNCIGKRSLANTLIMGVYNQPMRSISRMTGGIICWEQLNALIYMFNGHFHRGLHRYFFEGRKRKKVLKERKKEEK